MHAIAPAVANISLGVDTDVTNTSALDMAVTNLIASGVTVAVAAGNGMEDACAYSPGRVSTAITVATTDPLSDQQDPQSNFGTVRQAFRARR